jgi:WD40 repeat protein/serine/threonine protein kinase
MERIAMSDEKHERTAWEEHLGAWLAACDDALAAGTSPEALCPADLPPELRLRLKGDLAFLQRLRLDLHPDAAPRAPDTPDPGPTLDLRPTTPDVPDSGPTPQPAARGLGRFQIRRELGRGGFGVVYLADDPRLGRAVALKVPRADALATPELRRRFFQEARAAAALDHPNLVPVYEAGEAGPVCFIASAFCPGITLAEWLRGRAEPVPFRLAARLVATLADAVQHAHARGVVHRDLKPANVLLETRAGDGPASGGEGPDGLADFTPRITDFGLAKLVSDGTGAGPTKSGVILGTPSYMAPEQAEGQSRNVGPAADVYALGAILYELLTGRPPFRGESDLDTLRQVRDDEPVTPRRLRAGLPLDLETIVQKAMAREPRRRYEAASALAEDLHRFLEGRPILARRVSSVGRCWRWSKRNPWVAGLSAALLLALVSGTLVASLLAAAATRQATRANHLAGERERLLIDANLRLAALNYERGQAACTEGDVGLGLLRLVESWRYAVAVGDLGADWQHAARTSLSVWQRHHPALQTVFTHPAEVLAVAFSPHGKTVITGCADNTARLWDVATGQPRGGPMMHQDEVLVVAFSRDGTTVMTGSADNTARLWDAATGQPLGPPLTHPGWVRGVAFSADGKTVITGCNDKVARFWDVATGQPKGPSLTLPGWVMAVAFSPDGKTVITACNIKIARLWDVATGQPLGSPLAHQRAVHSVAFSPDGKTVLTGSDDNTARLWDAATGQPLGPPLVHQGWVASVAFSPDGTTVLTGSSGNTVRLWDAATGQPLGPPLTHPGVVRGVAFSPDGKTILTGSFDNTARLWDVATGRPRVRTLMHEGRLMTAAFSPNGTTVMTGSQDHTARLWDAATGQPLDRTLSHQGEVRVVAFRPDGTTLVTASDNIVRLWDAATGQPRGAPMMHQGSVAAIVFSPDGKTLVTSGMGGPTLWDAATGQPLGPFLKHPNQVSPVAFSPDGKTMITGCKDKTAQLWDTATGQPRGPALPHQDQVKSVAFSPDGKTVFTASGNNTGQFWDVATHRPVGPALAHRGGFSSVAFSPDSKTVVLGSRDNTAQLWHAATGQPLGPLLTHQGPVWSVAFRSDGKTVVTASEDHTARLWDVPATLPDELERIATWVQVLTGLELDEYGATRVLDSATWLRRRETLKQQGGLPVPGSER